MNVVGIKKLIKKIEFFCFFEKKQNSLSPHHPIIKNQWTILS
jgi:hypothetical protein